MASWSVETRLPRGTQVQTIYNKFDTRYTVVSSGCLIDNVYKTIKHHYLLRLTNSTDATTFGPFARSQLLLDLRRSPRLKQSS